MANRSIFGAAAQINAFDEIAARLDRFDRGAVVGGFIYPSDAVAADDALLAPFERTAQMPAAARGGSVRRLTVPRAAKRHLVRFNQHSTTVAGEHDPITRRVYHRVRSATMSVSAARRKAARSQERLS